MRSGILEWVCEVPLAEISLESVEGQQNRRGRVEGGRGGGGRGSNVD